MEEKILEYIKELTYRCNTINKGFIYLLTDSNFSFDKYNEYLIYSSPSSTKQLQELFKTSEISEEKQNYFFRHINNFFMLNEKYDLLQKYINVTSSLCAYLDNPISYIISILNKNFKNPQMYVSVFSSSKFTYLFYNQLSFLKKENIDFISKIKIEKSLFEQDNLFIYDKLNYYFNNINISTITFEKVISDVCNIYLKSIEDKSVFPSLKSSNENIIVNDPNKKKEEIDKLNDSNSKKENNIANKTSAILNSFFNPENSYIDSTYNKYKEMTEKLKYDSKDCRTLKSILYALTYILKDKDNKDFNAVKYMQNIINADVGWAVGDENNKEASFYGESDIAKFFYGYYSYMTGKENPYTELINNKIIKDMDYNAIMINKYFKDNGFANFGFTNEKLQEIYNILVNFKELVKVIDSPISLSGGIDNFIAGFVSSIMNSAANMLDFSLSSLVKELFYVEIITINKKRYSLAQIYNYVNFIKLIFERTADFKDISYIDREEFVNQAYVLLGINKDSLMKIGYLAYDLDMNANAGLSMYNEKLFLNQDERIFTLRNDLKLLYSLIQFGIQKKSVLSGDINFEKRFIYGDEYSVKDILEYLTDTEIYYVFTLYNINPWTLDDKLGSLTNEEILKFNKELMTIDGVYNHHINTFYNIYLDKNPNSIYNEMDDYDFKNTKYKTLISNMYNYYRKILKYNKQQLDIIIFESNDISDIDDFFVRFLPSISELMKTLGQNSDSLQSIAKFLDYILTFISEILFRNLFIETKISINRLLKKYTDSMFEKLNSYTSDEEITFNLNFGESKLMQSVDLLIDLIEKSNFNFFSISSCFGGAVNSNGGYDPMEEDSLVFNYGHNSISRNEFFDDGESIDNSYSGANTDKNIDINSDEQIYKNDEDKIKETIIYPTSEENKKIYYENGNIIIEKNDGTKEIIVSKNDINDINISYVEFPKIVEKNLSNDEYSQLIEIRDYINNITNKKLQYLNKQLTIVKNNLNIERNKTNPNYNNIKNFNKTIQKLTSLINDVKKENRIIESDNNTESTITIKDFNQNTFNSSEKNYSSLDNFFKNKKEILKEINEIIMDNNVTLTNYQITQLLK